jgi:hypothetical protein
MAYCLSHRNQVSSIQGMGISRQSFLQNSVKRNNIRNNINVKFLRMNDISKESVYIRQTFVYMQDHRLSNEK